MGKLGAFLLGAVIPTAVAVHLYRGVQEYKQEGAQAKTAYAQHVQAESRFLRELEGNLKPANSSVTGLVRTVVELSAESDNQEVLQDVVGMVRDYRVANQRMRNGISDRLRELRQYDTGRQGTTPAEGTHAALEAELTALQ